jgi:hypothetical protein
MTRWWVALGLLLSVAGCVGAPADDTPIASTSTLVSFSGYDLTPSSSVRLEYALQRSGPFVQFASTTTSAQAVTLQDGTKLYAWKVSAAVPNWKAICDGSESFVRARSQGGYFLISYEGAGPGGTPSGVSCVVQKLSDGEPTLASMLACASPESPVIRLTTAAGGLPKVHRGDVVVNTQTEADVYACVEQLTGSLTIGGSSSELSIALPKLQTVSGDLNLTWLRDPLVSPFLPTVRSINLSALESVGGNLVGTYQGIAADYITFDMGLEALSSVAGDIALELLNTSNGDLQGFDSMTAHAGDISVLGGSGDAAWYSLFPNLDSVAGDVHVRTGHSTYGVMRKLTSVGGDLWIEGSLLHTEGASGSFPLLQSVAGDLSFTGMEVTGAGAVVQALSDVGGQLSITDGGVGLATLSLGAGTGVDMHALALGNNPNLAAWNNGNWHVLGSGAIAISDNGSLPACAAENFVTTQQASGWTGSATLTGNPSCP